MASEVDIANLALSRLGDSATVAGMDPPEGSAQAEHCARFYPIARDSMLEMHNWKFATRRTVLARLATESWDWGCAYAEPSGTIKLLSVLPLTASSCTESEEFEAMGDADGTALILTNLEQATIKYIAHVTDTSKFSPLFVDALAWLLASHMAGPILKGDVGMKAAQQCLGAFHLVYGRATESDANQQQRTLKHSVGWIAGR
jgi:hypothetical protein